MMAPTIARPPQFSYIERGFFSLIEEMMANNNVETTGHPDMDYAEHEKTYALFLTLAKVGTIFCIAVLVFMAVTLL